MMKTIQILFAMAFVSLLVTQPVSALLTSVAFDPVGDACCNAPAFQDIVKARVTLRDGTFILLMELAGRLPAKPPTPPPGVSEVWWQWGLDLDPTTFPTGFPFVVFPAPPEFVVVVKSDGSAYSAFSVDRRPLLTGGDAIVAPIPFAIKGAEVKAFIDADVMGNPSSFGWAAFTVDWPVSPPSASLTSVDFLGPSTWPS